MSLSQLLSQKVFNLSTGPTLFGLFQCHQLYINNYCLWKFQIHSHIHFFICEYYFFVTEYRKLKTQFNFRQSWEHCFQAHNEKGSDWVFSLVFVGSKLSPASAWTCFKKIVSGGKRSQCLGFKFARPMKSHPSLWVSLLSPLHHLLLLPAVQQVS